MSETALVLIDVVCPAVMIGGSVYLLFVAWELIKHYRREGKKNEA